MPSDAHVRLSSESIGPTGLPSMWRRKSQSGRRLAHARWTQTTGLLDMEAATRAPTRPAARASSRITTRTTPNGTGDEALKPLRLGRSARPLARATATAACRLAPAETLDAGLHRGVEWCDARRTLPGLRLRVGRHRRRVPPVWPSSRRTHASYGVSTLAVVADWIRGAERRHHAGARRVRASSRAAHRAGGAELALCRRGQAALLVTPSAWWRGRASRGAPQHEVLRGHFVLDAPDLDPLK